MSMPTYSIGDVWSTGNEKRARLAPVENFVNAAYDSKITQNRIFLAYEDDENKKNWLKEIKNRHVAFMDPTAGTAEEPHKLYGLHFEHVNRCGPIWQIRVDEVEGTVSGMPGVVEAAGGNNPTDVQIQAYRDNLVRELNAAAVIYEYRCHPNYDQVLTPETSHAHRFFIRNIDLWVARIRQRYRAAGVVQYKPEVYSAASIIIYDPAEHELPVTTWTGGLLELDDIWYPYLQYEPRQTNMIGFQAGVKFEPSKDSIHTINVIPRLCPAIATTKEERLELLDYYVGTVNWNPQTIAEQATVTPKRLFITVQLEITS